MRFVKPVCIFSFCMLGAGLAVAASGELSACLNEGKREFALQHLDNAKAAFEHCLELDKNNEEALLSLGGVCLTQEEFSCARKYFLEALGKMKRNSPYLSYTYSMLGDIALKQGKNKEALAYYNRSLSINAANVNSLVGKGVIIESQGDKMGAAQVYQTALSVEPLNVIARKHLIALEPLYLTDKEVLEALKQRYAVMPDKEELSENDRELFVNIHRAEQHDGIGYLKNHYPQVPAEYTTTLFKDTSLAREVLTLNGYNALQKRIAQDAVGVFQKLGVPTQAVFDLRDLKGNKIFVDNTLTGSGMYVYHEALQNRKAFLLPNEEVPPTQQYLDKVSARVKELKEQGYIEISRDELAFIEQKTNCSRKTLRQQMGMYWLPVSKNNVRYFVFGEETAKPIQGVPWYYVAWYRSQRNPDIQIPYNRLIEKYSSYRQLTICSAVDGSVLLDE